MARGGMSKNPFGGNSSMSNLDDEFMASLFKGELTVDQTIALRVIKMSVRDYLFFGLGKNGITPEKFLEAYTYLFYTRGQDPRTWGDCSIRERYRNVDGIIESRTGTVLPKEVQAKCFDTHYDISCLSQKMGIERFLKLLKIKREEIVNANLKQIIAYMRVYRAQEWARQPHDRRKGKHAFPRVNVVCTLVSPEVPKDLAHLYLYGRTIKVKERPVIQSHLIVLKYKTLLFKETP